MTMKNLLIGIAFCLSFLMIGSEGEWFPFPNLLGIGIFFKLASYLYKERKYVD